MNTVSDNIISCNCFGNYECLSNNEFEVNEKRCFFRQSIEIPRRKIRKDHHKGPPEVINQHLGNQRTVNKKTHGTC